MSWTAAVDFRQGTHHRRAGAPCQDFGRLAKPNEDLLLGALADGAGSAPLSHLGAHAAVQAALDDLSSGLPAGDRAFASLPEPRQRSAFPAPQASAAS